MTTIFIKIWNYLPRLSLGLIFPIELYIIVKGKIDVVQFEANIKTTRELGDVTFSILFLIALLSVACFGMFLLHLITFYGSLLLKRMLKFGSKNKMLLPIVQMKSIELSFLIWKKHKKQICNFVRLKSQANPEIFKDYDNTSEALEKYIKDFEKSIEEITDIDLAYYLSYDSSVTQEQSISDNFKNIVEVLKYSCIIFLSTALILFDAQYLNKAFVVLLTFIWCVLVFQLYKKQKTRYAYYHLWSYVDFFSVVEQAGVEDRES